VAGDSSGRRVRSLNRLQPELCFDPVDAGADALSASARARNFVAA